MNSDEELLLENYKILHESVQNSHQYAWTLTSIFVPLIFASLAFLFKSAAEIDKCLFLIINCGIVATLLFWVFAIKFLQNCNKLRFHQLKYIEKILSSSVHSENEGIAFIYYRLFEPYLKQYFSENIYSGLTLIIPEYDHPYTTDFAYIDSNINLYINIEIDEPYAYKSGKATHYLSSKKDKRRNYFFLGRGWLVIRFSEEQIVRFPESCCKTVAETIANLLGDNSILSQFRHIPSLACMKQWTYEQARDMAMKNYRNNYL